MNEVLNMLSALIAGVILGIIFFGGLWITTQKGLRSKRPALVFTGSFIIRMTIILVGFYFIGQNSWQKLLTCLAGFLVARVVIVRLTQKDNHSKTTLIKEVPHEA
ncbi:MAG: ATP synthase subunit I [Bacteroidota bacterium]|nr:ATP synthase subunit I [Bacteroidota bacterium]